jgi:hypothetical protein
MEDKMIVTLAHGQVVILLTIEETKEIYENVVYSEAGGYGGKVDELLDELEALNLT